jgi:hypothetical protein
MKKTIIATAVAIALLGGAAHAADTTMKPGDSSTGAANKNTNSDGSAGSTTNSPGTTINQTENTGVNPGAAGKSTNSDGSSGATGSTTGSAPAGSQKGSSENP